MARNASSKGLPGPEVSTKGDAFEGLEGLELPKGMTGAPDGDFPVGPADLDEEFSFEYSDAPDIPVGRHIVKLVEVTQDVSKKSGNDMFVWVCLFLEPAVRGKKRTLYTSMAPNSRWKVGATLRAFGIKAADSMLKFKRVDVLGKCVAAVVVHEKRQDDDGMAANIQKLLPLTAEEAAQAESLINDAPMP